MANEKSRNHETTSRDKGGNGKAQGKQDSDKPNSDKNDKSGKTGSKPGPGKQARDQLNADAKSPGPAQ